MKDGPRSVPEAVLLGTPDSTLIEPADLARLYALRPLLGSLVPV